MDHRDVARSSIIEKYLLKELSPEECDEFEAHFFDCEECAQDLRLTDAFLEQVRRELKIPLEQVAPQALEQGQASRQGKGLPSFLRPVWLIPALAVLLLVIVYQNLFLYPGLKHQVATLGKPEILSSLSLVNGVSRGGSIPAMEVRNLQPFLLQVDIPGEEGFSNYLCSLYSPSGKLLWQSEVSKDQARDSVSIRVLPTEEMNGLNLLLVQGVSVSGQRKTPVDLVRYRFQLTFQK
ncbi:MAG TPA: zf-HC2 domain-containing protein [Acidisarcina sp.]|nr:zf-HC2 domain-containing protein [Acidisarcina sp.]